MLQAIIDVLKQSMRPSSVGFLIAVLAIGVVVSFVRRTVGRWYLLAAGLGFWVFSTPACTERLVAWRADGFRPIAHASEARGARTVVVLAGGSSTVSVGGLTLTTPSRDTALRVVEGARLYRLLDRPTIILSGGVTSRDPDARPECESMRDAILVLGVPIDHVVLETRSKTTREQATIISRMLGERRREPIVVVTTPTHIRRSIWAFGAEGLDAVPSVAAYKSDHAFQRHRWLPNDGGLALFDAVVYDTTAELYYRLRGWASTR